MSDLPRPRIAFLTETLDDVFQSELMQIVVAEGAAHGFDVISIEGGVLGRNEGRDFAYGLVHDSDVSGVLLAAHTVGCLMGPEYTRRFAQRFEGLPVVSLGQVIDGFPSVAVGNEDGIRAVVQHMILQHGATEFAYLGGPEHNEEAEAREKGFLDCLYEHAIEANMDWMVHGDFTPAGGRAAVLELLSRVEELSDVDAIICANDHTALAAMEALNERGYRIPADVALTGFDDIDAAHLAQVPLTTVRQPIRDQVDRALELLKQAIDGETPKAGESDVETHLMLRRSCGCGLSPKEIVSVFPAPDEAATLGERIDAIRDQMQAEMSVAALRYGSSLPFPEDWNFRLTEALLKQLEGTSRALVDLVDRYTSLAVQDERPLAPLREALSRMRRRSLSLTEDESPENLRLERVFESVLLVVGGGEARAEARRRNLAEHRSSALTSVTAHLIAARSDAVIWEIVRRDIPNLGINTCIVVLFESPQPDGTVTRNPVFSMINGEVARLSPWGESEGALPDVEGLPEALVIEPLLFQGDPLGYAIFDYSEGQGSIYVRLVLALAAVLHSSRLSRELQEAYEEIQALALKDPLTDVANRRHLSIRLAEETERVARYDRPLSLCIVDLDGFKRINDEQGHGAGDEVLKETGRRIRDVARKSDFVARFGGDEFVIVLPEADEAAARRLALRAVSALEHMDPLGIVSASIGVATVHPGEDFDGEQLLQRADSALLRAKAAGKNQYMVHVDPRRRE